MTVFEIVSAVFSTISLVIAILSLIEVKAMQRSTHRVSFYDPTTQEFSAPVTPAQAKELNKDTFDNI